MIIPATIALAITPTYLFTNDYLTLAIGFSVQGLFGGAIYGQNPSYLSERFPTEVSATAAGFCYHQGAIFGGLVAPVLTYIAVNYNVGFGVAMMVGTTVGLVRFIIALLLGPETKGTELVSVIISRCSCMKVAASSLSDSNVAPLIGGWRDGVDGPAPRNDAKSAIYATNDSPCRDRDAHCR
jgi:MFS family permease